MKKSLAGFLCLILLCSLIMCGCGNSTKKLTGTWDLVSGKTDLETIMFFSDGSCQVNNEEMGTWSIVDGNLRVLGAYGGLFFNYDNFIGTYSIKSKTLTVNCSSIDGDSTSEVLVYERR